MRFNRVRTLGRDHRRPRGCIPDLAWTYENGVWNYVRVCVAPGHQRCRLNVGRLIERRVPPYVPVGRRDHRWKSI